LDPDLKKKTVSDAQRCFTLYIGWINNFLEEPGKFASRNAKFRKEKSFISKRGKVIIKIIKVILDV
jgi:hypothetical protein